MMEDHGDRKQAETLPMEGSSPKEIPGIVGESHIREENAALSEPSGTEKFPERESEREEYWNSVLTGDVMTIPREVRMKAEAMYPAGTADRERIAACVMQSWVADSGAIPRERIRRDWKSIREQVARQYGASGKSDDELFVAVSMHNQVRLSRRETLFELVSNLLRYFRWSNRILQSELLMILSFTMGEEIISSTSCVTTIASPKYFLTVLYKYFM